MRNSTLWCAILIFLAGNIVGLGIGYVGVTIQSYSDATNCSRIEYHEENCRWADRDVCIWNGTVCRSTARVFNNSCSQILSRSTCENEENYCIWTRPRGASADSCLSQQGWSRVNTAWFATVAILGGIVGSILGHTAIVKTGLNNSIALAGIASILAGVLLIVGWRSYDDDARLGLLLTGRVFVGIASGMLSAAVPMYIGDVAPRESSGVLGVGFQVCITFGIMTAAMAAFAANPTESNMSPRTGITGINIYYVVLSVALVPLAYFAERPLFDDSTRQSLLTFRSSGVYRLNKDNGVGGGGGGGAAPLPNGAASRGNYGGAGGADLYGDNPGESSSPAGFSHASTGAGLCSRPLYVAVAMLIAASQQFSGINMIMSYVAQMASDVGMENPYLANFIVMIWNFVSALVAIYLATRLTAGNMFLLGQCVAALSCFMVAVPIRFFDEHDSSAQAVIITGIMLFIFAFEFGMGPSFYVLAQSMFPSEIRPAGCAFTIFTQYVCNALVNFLYPILVKTFSGGASKPQGKGIAIMFFIYGGLGLGLTLALRKVIQLIKAEHEAPVGEEIGAIVETSRDVLTQY